MVDLARGPTACSAPMASRLWCLLTVRLGCLPRRRDHRDYHDSLGFDQGLRLCPVAPRERSERLARPPRAVSGCLGRPRSGAWRIRSIRPRRPSIERHGASVSMPVHLPPQVDHTRVSRHCGSAPWRRHPRAVSAASAPGFHRPSGYPVCRDGSRPCHHTAAPT